MLMSGCNCTNNSILVVLMQKCVFALSTCEVTLSGTVGLFFGAPCYQINKVCSQLEAARGGKQKKSFPLGRKVITLGI